MRWKLCATLVLSAAGAAPLARAEQFVLVDKVVTQMGGSSHYSITTGPDQPKSWYMPVDYTQGTIYERIEVITKPSDVGIFYGTCFWGLKGPGSSPKAGRIDEAGCGVRSPVFTKPGVGNYNYKVRQMGSFDHVDWSHPLEFVGFIMVKAATNEQVGGGPNYYPTMVRFTVTVVSKGGTYVPPPGVPAMMPADAGADTRTPDAMPAAVVDARGPADASAPLPDVPPALPDVAPAVVPDAQPAVTRPDATPAPATDDSMDDPAPTRPPSRPASGCSLGRSAPGDGDGGIALLPAAMALVLAIARGRFQRGLMEAGLGFEIRGTAGGGETSSARRLRCTGESVPDR